VQIDKSKHPERLMKILGRPWMKIQEVLKDIGVLIKKKKKKY